MFKQTAIALVLALSGVSVAVTVPAVAKEAKKKTPTGKLSKEAQKILVELDKASKANDLPTVAAKIAALDALPGKNSYDSYVLSQYRFDYGKKSNDKAMVNRAFEEMAASEYLPDEFEPNTLNRRTVIQSLFAASYNEKNYPKALEWGEKYLALNPADAAFQQDMITTALMAKDYGRAESMALAGIASAKAAGTVPPESVYLTLSDIYQRQKSPKFSASLIDLTKAYPTAKNWTYLLEDFQTRSGLSGRVGIDLYRLMNVAGILESPGSVIEAATVALDAGVPGDAKEIITKADAAGRLADRKGEAMTLLKSAAAAIASEEAPAKQEAAANTGDRLGAVGQLYLSLGNYSKATDVYAKAIAKGLRNKNEANIRYGIAQFKAGNKDGAKAAWGAVSGDAKMTELASLWTLFANIGQQ